jgi:hypothetical protein
VCLQECFSLDWLATTYLQQIHGGEKAETIELATALQHRTKVSAYTYVTVSAAEGASGEALADNDQNTFWSIPDDPRINQFDQWAMIESAPKKIKGYRIQGSPSDS